MTGAPRDLEADLLVLSAAIKKANALLAVYGWDVVKASADEGPDGFTPRYWAPLMVSSVQQAVVDANKWTADHCPGLPHF